MDTTAAIANIETSESLDFDAIVIGAGVSGLYQLISCASLG
jgi:cation diffusion facilitator CzcD-associated flavoprotein CzcO